LKAALSAALLVFVLALTGGTVLIVRDVHRDLADVHTNLVQMHTVLVHASAATDNFAIVMAKVSTTADTLNGAAGEERKNWAATSQEAAYTGRALRLLISRVDRSFVDGTLLHLNAETLPAIDAQIATNGGQLEATLAKLGQTADGVTAATGTLNTRLEDPEITALFAHVNGISANLETVAANSAAMSGDMKLAVHRLAQPPTKVHQFLDAAWTTAKFGSLFIP
jgi:hypothetical protein